MQERPSDRFEEDPTWAEQLEVDPETNQFNVIAPTNEMRFVGYKFRSYPSRNHWNWLFRTAFRWIRYLRDRQDLEKTADGNGIEIFAENSLITLYAVDKTVPANYIHAAGYRGVGLPVLNTISNNVLTLGVAGSDGTYSISGGNVEDVIIYANSKKIEE